MERIEPTHPRYEELRALHNGMVDRRPAVIARCESPEEVAEALGEANRSGLEVAVRAGGHSVAGMSTNEGGLVVDVRPMKAIEVDPTARRARVGAGVTWGELDRATQEHGLAVTGGRVSTTGVAGFTLGGGSGWVERSFGLACDNLVSVDLVTASGQAVTASSGSHPELFWALHGGGGNFGVATTLELALHPLGPEVLAGLAMWPAERAREVAGLYTAWAEAAPDELGSGLVMLTAPDEEFVPDHLRGTTVLAVVAMWAGDPATGEEVLAALRGWQPAVDLVEPRPYVDFQCMIDDPPGYRNWWTADYHDDFPDAALDAFVASGLGRPHALTQQILLPWGGAVARVDDAATPMNHRGTRWVSHPFAVWEDAADDERAIAWGRRFRDDIAAWTNGGVYLNFVGREGQDRVRAAYGEHKYARLQAVKAEYDPANVFRGNQNIVPAATVPSARSGADVPSGARAAGR